MPNTTMPTEVASCLKKIISVHGPEIEQEPQRLEGLLRDYCPSQTLEIELVLAAVNLHVVRDLQKMPCSLSASSAEQLSVRLHQQKGYDKRLALWTVQTWADALGIVSVDAAYSSHFQSNAQRFAGLASLFSPIRSRRSYPQVSTPSSSSLSKQPIIRPKDRNFLLTVFALLNGLCLSVLFGFINSYPPNSFLAALLIPLLTPYGEWLALRPHLNVSAWRFTASSIAGTFAGIFGLIVGSAFGWDVLGNVAFCFTSISLIAVASWFILRGQVGVDKVIFFTSAVCANLAVLLFGEVLLLVEFLFSTDVWSSNLLLATIAGVSGAGKGVLQSAYLFRLRHP